MVAERQAQAQQNQWTLEQYDLNNDNLADVFKYYAQKPNPQNPASTLPVLVRKEVDVNHDGTLDMIQLFDDTERLTEQRFDLDFDGHTDEVAFFEEGKVRKKEMDVNFDGTTDAIKYYGPEFLERIEIDRNLDGKMDRWEYYEKGILDRIGFDDDYNGEVDRWQRKDPLPETPAPTNAEQAPATLPQP
jgi:hypothetical protein